MLYIEPVTAESKDVIYLEKWLEGFQAHCRTVATLILIIQLSLKKTADSGYSM